MKALVAWVLLLLLGASCLAQRETMQEAAVHARELIQYRAYGVGTLMSRYPADFEIEGVQGLPIGLQEYYAVYPDSHGDILLLAMPISKIFRNALPPNPPNMTLTISDLYGFGTGNLAAGRMRVALFGTLERVPQHESDKCKKAYLEAHPDARGWAGEKGPHSSFWARFKVEKVYAFDGFGDVAYIGWLPLEMYHQAGKKMRSRKEVHSHWPVPRQPPDSSLVTPGGAEWLFAETSLRMSEAPSEGVVGPEEGGYEEGVRRVEEAEGRFRIQWK